MNQCTHLVKRIHIWQMHIKFTGIAFDFAGTCILSVYVILPNALQWFIRWIWAHQLTVPILFYHLYSPFRSEGALNTKNKEVMCVTLKILQQMVMASDDRVGPGLVPFYRQLLPMFNAYKSFEGMSKTQIECLHTNTVENAIEHIEWHTSHVCIVITYTHVNTI